MRRIQWCGVTLKEYISTAFMEYPFDDYNGMRTAQMEYKV